MHDVKKMMRDLWSGRGRAAMMITAIAVGLMGLAAVLGAYGILTREIKRNYLDTLPASATLELEDVPAHLLRDVRRRPEFAAAERRATLQARFRRQASGPWQRALVFVVDDFRAMPLARIFHQRGALSPPLGTVLVERSATALTGDVGDTLWLDTPDGEARQVTVSGVVHEPALAPAITEQSAYIYIATETLGWLGAGTRFVELRVARVFASRTQPALPYARKRRRLRRGHHRATGLPRPARAEQG